MQLTFETARPAVGAVYTPARLVRFVIDAAKDTEGRLPQGRWIDPACGDGAFLVALVEDLLAQVGAAALASAVEERVFGLDIDPTACTAARQAVRSVVEAHVGPQGLAYFEDNVVCTDALNAWPCEGRFGLVVGNPPYVGATELAADEKQRYLRDFATAWGRIDLYGLFIERATSALDVGGRLAMITPDKLLTAASCRPLRAHLARGFAVVSIARFDQHDLFPGVATVPCVATVSRIAPEPSAPSTWWRHEHGSFEAVGDALRVRIDVSGAAWLPAASFGRQAIEVGDIVERVSVGVATGLNACFVMTSERALELKIETSLLRAVVRGRDIGCGDLRASGKLLLLPYSFDAAGRPSLVDLERFPNAQAHLEGHRELLEARHCVRVWDKAWYDLHDPVVDDLAAVDKVVCPDLSRTARFAHEAGRLIPLHSAYYLVPARGGAWSAAALARALCHPDVERQILDRAPTAKSGYRRVQADVLRSLRLPIAALDASPVAA